MRNRYSLFAFTYRFSYGEGRGGMRRARKMATSEIESGTKFFDTAANLLKGTRPFFWFGRAPASREIKGWSAGLHTGNEWRETKRDPFDCVPRPPKDVAGRQKARDFAQDDGVLLFERHEQEAACSVR